VRVQARIADFGLARSDSDDSRSTVTKTGEVGGSFAYMAAEQAADFHQATPRSDVWSLGAIIYETLTGRLPRPMTAHASIVQQIAEVREGRTIPIDEVRRDLPPALTEWLTNSLHHAPGARFEDAGAMRRALRKAVAGTELLR